MRKLFIDVLSKTNSLLGIHIHKGTEYIDGVPYYYDEIAIGLLLITFRFSKYIKQE